MKATVRHKTATELPLFPAIMVVGPTAIGKTAAALRIAELVNGEIVSVDSMQVYRHMDIGTAKPTPSEQAAIKHHLIDIVDPDEDYSAAGFVSDCLAAMTTIREHGRIPVLVGGTGLYFKALLQGLFDLDLLPGTSGDVAEIRAELKQRLASHGREALYVELQGCDPLSAARIHPNDTQRLLRALEIFLITGIPWSTHLQLQSQSRNQPPSVVQQQSLRMHSLRLGLTCEREKLYQRINARVQAMVDQGLEDEVKWLLTMGYGPTLKSMQSIGYRHMIRYLNNEWTMEQTLSLLARDTRRYAKRQYTWFGADSDIVWCDPSREDEMLSLVYRYLQRRIASMDSEYTRQSASDRIGKEGRGGQ